MVNNQTTDLRQRIQGAMYGLAAGDALGAVTEGMTRSRIREKFGRIDGFLQNDQSGTDDTEFALFYTRLLERYGTAITSDIIARHWLDDIYHSSETYKGAGFSETMTLQNLKRGLRPPESGQHLHSWSDGLAMCAAPFGCINPGDPEKAASLAETFGRVSHSEEGIYGGIAVAAGIAEALKQKTDTASVIMAALRYIPSDSWLYYNIKTAVQIAGSGLDLENTLDQLYQELACDYYYWSDLAPEAVSIAFGLFVYTGADFRNAVLSAVNLGRDSDTIAAIGGALCGALKGIAVIPDQFIARVESVPGRCIRSMAGEKVGTAAEILYQLAVKGGEE